MEANLRRDSFAGVVYFCFHSGFRVLVVFVVVFVGDLFISAGCRILEDFAGDRRVCGRDYYLVSENI